MKNIEVENDGLLTICTGSSRKTRVWKQKQVSWSKLLQRLGTTKRTNEEQAQYFKLGKERQNEIKDVGGFVGGELEGGRRTALSVINRQLITLDADFAQQNLWDKLTSIFDNAACVYSTHKHTKDTPRLRLVMPIDRPVSPDEYQAISRKVAESLGIDNFDDTTYQPHRLMFFPSTSNDAEFYFQWQDGLFLSADSILAEYDDWQDISSWPRSARSKELVNHEVKQAEDPLTKTGLIGAFCRAYSIQDAIEHFLSDVYEKVNDDRYTFRAGTGAGGAIVYENKWLYSFHSTDPCSLLLCNAFDLVRIHKFGELDIGKEKKDLTNLPSHIKMLDFCAKDDKVKILMAEEAQSDFDDLGDEKLDMSWATKLRRNPKTGTIVCDRANIQTILENDPRLKDTFAYDAFAQRIAITKPIYWRNKNDTSEFWNDSDDAQLRYFMESYFGIDSSKKIDDAVINVAKNKSFHRVREYLNNLHWDGKKRIDKLFIKYLGAPDDNFIKNATRKSLVAAVARVMTPGVKFDNMIVLTGEQGIGKSYLLSKLAHGWFSDTLTDLRNKDAYEGLRGKWIIELSEMSFLKKTDNDTAKLFISKQSDYFREAFGKRAQDFPRQCIFFGTTNEMFYLKDRTGNRRFLPIVCNRSKRKKSIFNEENLDEEINQIWAEAVVAWRDNEPLWIGEEMEQQAKKIQEQHMEENPIIGAIEKFLDKPIPTDWYSRNAQRRVEFCRGIGDFDEDVSETVSRDKVCALEIWFELFGGDLKKFPLYEMKNITDALLSMKDWELSLDKLNFGDIYGYQRAFIRKKEIVNNDLPV